MANSGKSYKAEEFYRTAKNYSACFSSIFRQGLAQEVQKTIQPVSLQFSDKTLPRKCKKLFSLFLFNFQTRPYPGKAKNYSACFPSIFRQDLTEEKQKTIQPISLQFSDKALPRKYKKRFSLFPFNFQTRPYPGSA